MERFGAVCDSTLVTIILFSDIFLIILSFRQKQLAM